MLDSPIVMNHQQIISLHIFAKVDAVMYYFINGASCNLNFNGKVYWYTNLLQYIVHYFIVSPPCQFLLSPLSSLVSTIVIACPTSRPQLHSSLAILSPNNLQQAMCCTIWIGTLRQLGGTSQAKLSHTLNRSGLSHKQWAWVIN